MKRTTLLLMMVGLFWEAAAQPNLDSLFAVWKDAQQPDSLRATAYYNYLWDGYLNSKPDTAYLLAEELIAFAEAREFPLAKVQAFNLQAIVLQMQGNNAGAISYFQKSIAIAEGSAVHGERRVNLFSRRTEDVPKSAVLVDGLTHDLARFGVANEEVERVTVVGELS